MTRYIAFVRAVNVGGTGKLPMATLKAMCEDAGFDRVVTYIASGNVMFDTGASAVTVRRVLEKTLAAYAGKAVAVFVRSAGELRAVLAANPFKKEDPRYVYAFFLNSKPAKAATAQARRRTDERIALGKREIYVHYPSGMGRSRLVLPAAEVGTARNLNTVAKLVEMSANR